MKTAAIEQDGAEGRNPVLLIHGIWDDSSKMARVASHLREAGWEVHTLDLVPSDGSVGLDKLAHQVAAFVEKTFAAEFDIVGFSMGGLVSRYYLQRLGGLSRVKRFVTVSAPHNGSLLAWFNNVPGCVQMRPGSAFLCDLESDVERLAHIQFTSIWTRLDLMIFPAWSSVLPVGKTQHIWCVAHPLMVREPRVLQVIEAALSGRREVESLTEEGEIRALDPK